MKTTIRPNKHLAETDKTEANAREFVIRKFQGQTYSRETSDQEIVTEVLREF